MEFGLVRQKVKLKNSTHMPTVQMGAKRHHLRVGTISGSWSQGPNMAPGPPIPRVPGWGAGQGVGLDCHGGIGACGSLPGVSGPLGRAVIITGVHEMLSFYKAFPRLFLEL